MYSIKPWFDFSLFFLHFGLFLNFLLKYIASNYIGIWMLIRTFAVGLLKFNQVIPYIGNHILFLYTSRNFFFVYWLTAILYYSKRLVAQLYIYLLHMADLKYSSKDFSPVGPT